MSDQQTGARIELPPGVKIGAGRETSWTNDQGMVVQGMAFGITLPNGTTTSVNVPYGEIHDTAAVQRIIDRRVHALLAITG